MNSTQLSHATIVSLIADSGPMAKLVLLVLLVCSIFCWGIIFMKWRTLKRSLRQNSGFLNVFWHGKNIDEILAKADKFAGSPVVCVFRAGVREMKKLSADELGSIGPEGMENIYRALIRSSNSEVALLERYTGWLATTASAAPFIGLFGTVWGIMNAFQSIGATGAANLAVVAPGISEALVTTAMGIAAAVPAVVAYNHFAGQVRRLATDMECFSHDFMNIIQRGVLGGRKGN